MAKRKNRAKRKALLCPIPARNRRGQVARPGQGTREASAVAVGYEARVRHGCDPKNTDNPLSGYPVGQAVLAKRLSRADHDLCYGFALMDEAARRADGRPPINPPAITIGAARGRAGDSEPSAEDLAALKAYRRVRDRLVALLGSAGFIQFENIVLSDCAIHDPAGLFVLQLGCNALRRGP
jgi:hypothetical protein